MVQLNGAAMNAQRQVDGMRIEANLATISRTLVDHAADHDRDAEIGFFIWAAVLHLLAVLNVA